MTALGFVRPRGFSLDAAADFYAGFTPGSGMAVASTGRLTLAFRLDESFEAVAVELTQTGERVIGELSGSEDADRATRQVERMLGLSADGDQWLDVGRKDPVVGKLQREFPGFFCAAKPSPYDAAAWGVISPRMSMRVAARLKMAISAKHGDAVTSRGVTHHVFPAPEQVLDMQGFVGLSEVKLERLKGIARAALDGKLEADRLSAMSVDDALSELQRLPGVGPWTASHILFRGAALRDGLPTAEPRVLHGLAEAYGLRSPSAETLAQLAEAWRPFRTWVCVLLARHLASAGGWNKPGLSRERAAAGRRLSRRGSRTAQRHLG